MSRPSPEVWAAVKNRDDNRCVACQTTQALTFQHRKATGAGGSKVPPTIEEGLTLCAICNVEVERGRQAEAIECGWKVQWKRENCLLIPVFYPRDLAWFRFEGDQRHQITVREAQDMFDEVYGKAA